MDWSFRIAPTTSWPNGDDRDRLTPAGPLPPQAGEGAGARVLRREAPAGDVDLMVRGDGQTVLFIPGSYSTGAAWRPLLAQLPNPVRHATLSLCGYGETTETRSPEDASIAHEVAVVRAALAHLATPVTLVGHSFGATVALAAALSFPEHVAGLVLFEANPMDVLRLSGDDLLLAEAHSIVAAFEAAVAEGVEDAPALIIDYWNGSGSFEQLPEPVRAYCRQKAVTNILDWRADFGFGADGLSAIACPVVAARGSLANPAMVAITDALVERLPVAALHIVEGAGHFPIATHPAESAALVGAFLSARQVRRRPGPSSAP